MPNLLSVGLVARADLLFSDMMVFLMYGAMKVKSSIRLTRVRRIGILIMSVLVSHWAVCQNRTKVHHIIKKSIVESGKMQVVYKDRENKAQPVRLCSERLNGVIRMEGTGPVIDFWPIRTQDGLEDPQCISGNTELGRFEIDLSRRRVGDPVRFVNVPFSGWIAGIGTIPLRFRAPTRHAQSTFSSQVGINITYGKYFGHSKISQRAITHYGLMIGPFVGITSVRLEKATVENPNTWPIDKTNAAVTYGINVAVTRGNLGVVLFWGYDHDFGKDAATWVYQNRTWLGVGINTYIGVF